MVRTQNNWVGFGILGRLLGVCRVRCARVHAFCSFEEGKASRLGEVTVRAPFFNNLETLREEKRIH